jgi:hypothetical protein
MAFFSNPTAKQLSQRLLWFCFFVFAWVSPTIIFEVILVSPPQKKIFLFGLFFGLFAVNRLLRAASCIACWTNWPSPLSGGTRPDCSMGPPRAAPHSPLGAE